MLFLPCLGSFSGGKFFEALFDWGWLTISFWRSCVRKIANLGSVCDRRVVKILSQFLSLLGGCSFVFLLPSCGTAKSDGMQLSNENPVVDGNGPLLRFQSFIFEVPDDYQVLKGAVGAHVAGVYSSEDGEALVERLRKRKGFDLVSAPAVICRNGKVGRVDVFREFTYPTEYDPPQVIEAPAKINEIFPVTPSSPKSFETRNLGVGMAFKGRKAGGQTVDFEVELSRSAFLGFINYGSPITTSAKGFLGKPVDVVVTENRVEMPVFDSKRVSSSVMLESGQYLAVGGLSADLQGAVEKLTKSQREGLEPARTLFVLIRVELFE